MAPTLLVLCLVWPALQYPGAPPSGRGVPDMFAPPENRRPVAPPPQQPGARDNSPSDLYSRTPPRVGSGGSVDYFGHRGSSSGRSYSFDPAIFTTGWENWLLAVIGLLLGAAAILGICVAVLAKRNAQEAAELQLET
ncbi:MAG TPA: hypothetical protein PKD86_15045 [Gemmatales bacterium]|nr:hypothetical protein [Gemmatales bacterium]HMP60659.1 hypothetical protein [Gemmatales bacterium]